MDIDTVLADDQRYYLIFGGRRSGLFDKNVQYNIAANQTTDSFKIQQNIALLYRPKNLSLRPTKHTSTGRLYLIWLLPNKIDSTGDLSGRPINKINRRGFGPKN